MDDTILVKQAQSGRLEAFNQLVLHHQTPVYNFSLRMLNDPDLAEDVTQNAFIAAYRGLQSFRGGCFRAWLMRITANACYDEMRRSKRHQWVALNPVNEDGDEIETPGWLVDGGESPEEALVRHDLRQTLQQCLRKLGPEVRAIVLMVDLLGMDYLEVAQVFNVPLGTVKSRLARARLKMRDWLKEAENLRKPVRLQQPRLIQQHAARRKIHV